MPTLLDTLKESSEPEETKSSSQARKNIMLAQILDETLENKQKEAEKDGGSFCGGSLRESVSGSLQEISNVCPDAMEFLDDNQAQLNEIDSAITDLEKWRKERAEVVARLWEDEKEARSLIEENTQASYGARAKSEPKGPETIDAGGENVWEFDEKVHYPHVPI